jgi:hypothetical protein
VRDGEWLDPPCPDDEETAAELVWSIRQELPEREVMAAREMPFEEAFSLKDDFRFTPWGERPRLSHACVLYRDECRDPAELCDMWVPEALVSPADLGGADSIEELDLTGRGGTRARPYRASEWVHVFEPRDRDRILLELDVGAAAISITREYRNLVGDVLGVEHRWVRIGSILQYVRNLPWERAVLRDFFPSEFHDWPEPWWPGP